MCFMRYKNTTLREGKILSNNYKTSDKITWKILYIKKTILNKTLDHKKSKMEKN